MFQDLNYTNLFAYGALDSMFLYTYLGDLVEVVIMEVDQSKVCFERNNTHTQPENTRITGKWQAEGRRGCLKRTGYEEGIPVWKIFTFHTWGNPAHLLGPKWTLGIEDYAKWSVGKNSYLG